MRIILSFSAFFALQKDTINLMNSELFFGEKRYILVKEASQLSGYSKDYIGQLARDRKIESRRVGKKWYVGEASLLEYKNTPTDFDFSKNLLGKAKLQKESTRFILIKEASILTGYSKDYIGQLARNQKIESKRIGKKWYVGEASLVEYKNTPTNFDFSQNFQGKEVLSKKLSTPLPLSPYVTTLEKSVPVSVSRGRVASPSTYFYKKTLSFMFGLVLAFGASSVTSAELRDLYNKTISIPGNLYSLLEQVSSSKAFSNPTQFASETFSKVNSVRNSALAFSGSNPLDTTGAYIYNTVNSFFDITFYSPLASFFGTKPKVVAVVPVPKKPITIVTKPAVSIATSTKSTVPAVLVKASEPQTKVVERIIEKFVPDNSYFAAVDQKIADLYTKISSDINTKLSNLSTGNGGSITNVYNQIAGSQKIDNLTNTLITNPTIKGGTITGTSITTDSISSTNLFGGSITGGGLVIGGNGNFSGTLTAANIIATSSFSAPGFTITGVSINSLLSTNAFGVISATSTPTFGNFNATSTTATSTISTGGFAIGGSQFVVQQNRGFVGIGTTSPFTNLGVNGDGYFSGNITASNVIATSSFSTPSLTLSGTSANSILATNASGTIVATSTPTFGNFNATSTNATSTIAGGFKIGNSGFVYDFTTGNVGIGTSSASNKFEVNGNSYFSGTGFFEGILNLASSLFVNGNSTFGNSTTTDVAYFNSRIGSSLIPTADNALDLGDASNWLRWRSGYFGTSVAIGGTATSTGTSLLASGVYNIDSAGILSINTTNNQPVNFGTGKLSFTYASTTNLTTFGNTYLATLGGNVGIGTTSPFAPLSVQGNGYFSGSVTAGNLIATSSFSTPTITITSVSTNSLLSTNASGVITATSTPTFGNFNATSTTATSTISTGGFAIGTSQFVVQQNSGNVGVGTSSPFTNLSVTGNGYFSGTNYVGGLLSSNTLNVGNGNFTVSALGEAAPTHLYLQNQVDLFGTAGTGLVIRDYNTGTKGGVIQVDTANTFKFRNLANNGDATTTAGIGLFSGNLGVGTTSPFTNLSVQGNGYFAGNVTATNFAATSSISTPSLTLTGLSINSLLSTNSSGVITATSTPTFGNFNATSTTATSTISTGGFAIGTSQFVVQQNSGNVGVGTLNPTKRFTVKGDAIGLFNSSDVNTALLQEQGSGEGQLVLLNGGVNQVSIRANGDSYFARTTGNVGIGTTSPYVKLSVAGSAVFTGGDVLTSTLTATSSVTVGTNLTLGTTLTQLINLGNSAFIGTVTGGSDHITLGNHNGNVGVDAVLSSGQVWFQGFNNSGDTAIVKSNQFLATGSITTPALTLSGVSTNSLLSTNASGVITATSTPTFGNFNATSTTATSTIAGGLAVGTNYLNVLQNGNIGIGTAAPAYKLDITGGNVRLQGVALMVQDATPTFTTYLDQSSTLSHLYNNTTKDFAIGTNNSTSQLYLKSGGNVGVGTTSPFTTFSVQGSGYFAGDITATNLIATSSISTPSLTLSGTSINSLLSTNSSGAIVATSTPTFGNFNATSTNATSTIAGGLAIKGTGFVYDYSTNFVGIGTASPSQALTVVGNLRFNAGNSNIDFSGGGTIVGSGNININPTSGGLVGIGTTSPFAKLAVNPVAGDTNQFVVGSSTKTSFIINSAGNVGIGTTNPTRALEIGNGGTSPAAIVRLNDSNDAQQIIFAHSSTDRFRIRQAGAGLNFESLSTGAGGVGRFFNFSAGTLSNGDTNNALLSLSGTFSDASNKYYGLVVNPTNTASAVNSAIADFRIGGVSKVFFDVNGNVGIGTTSPYRTLSVVGSGVFTGGDVLASTFTATSTITTGQGSATLPSIVFSGDNTTGFYRDAGSVVRVSIGGNRVASFVSTGLQLLGGTTAASGPSLSIDAAGTTGLFNPAAGTIGFSAAGTESMRITSAGNLGIGTTSPSSKLAIAGSVYVDGDIRTTNLIATSSISTPSLTLTGLSINSLLSTNASGVITATSTPTFGNFNATSTNATSTIAGGFKIGNSGFVYDFITGNVGIGTSSASNKFEVNGGAYFSGSGFFGGAIVGTSTLNITGLTTLVNASTTQLTSSNSAYFATAGGRVGIATTSPGATLGVGGNGYFTGGLGVGVLNTSAGTIQTSGDVIVGGALTVNGALTSSITTGQIQFLAVPTGTAINQGSVYLNPASAGTNNVLLGVAVNGTEKARIDAEGDVQVTGTFNSTNTTGTNSLSGHVTVAGNTTLGDASSDTVTLNGSVASSIIPNSDLAYNLGSPTFRFGNIFVGTTTVSNLVAGGTASSTFIINTGNTSADTEDATLAFSRGISTPNATLKWNSTLDQFEFNDYKVNFANSITAAGTATSTIAGTLLLTGTPYGTNLGQGSLYINPSSASTDRTLIGAGVNGVERFRVDAEGDTTIAGSLGTQNAIYNITLDTLTVDDKLQINGNAIKDSTGTTRLTIGATNTFTGDLSVGSGAITSGLINGQTISSTANFTGTLTVAGVTTLSNLTPSRLVATDGSSNLVSTITAANLLSSVSGTTGTGNLVFSLSPTFTGTAGFVNTTNSGTLDVTGKTTLGYASTTQISSSGSAYFATSGGSVGIGSTNPVRELHIVSASPEIRLEASGTNSSTLELYNGATRVGFLDGSNNAGLVSLFADTNNAIRFSTNGSEKVRIDTAGNFGIGTTTPYRALSVQGSAVFTGGDVLSSTLTATSTITGQALILTGSGSSGGIGIGGTSLTNGDFGLKYNGSGGMFTSFSPSRAISFGINSVEVGRFDTAGNFGIATTSPSSKLAIAGSVYVDGDIRVTNLIATSSISTPSLTLTGLSINSLLSTNASGVITATSTPTFGNFNATSTTATSTISTGGLTVGGNQFLVQQNSGNIGVGTTTPSAIVDIYKNTAGPLTGLHLDLTDTNVNQTSYGADIKVTGTQSTGGILYGLNMLVDRQGSSVGPVYGTNVTVNTGSRNGGSTITSLYGGKFVLNGSNVVSTANNISNFGLYGEVNNATASGENSQNYGVYGKVTGASSQTTYGVYATASGGTTNYGVYSAAGTNYFAGNLGIGTTTPGAPLEILGGYDANNPKSLSIAGRAGGTGAVYSAIQFGRDVLNQTFFGIGADSRNGSSQDKIIIGGGFGTSKGATAIGIYTGTYGSAATTERLSIDSSGNVGIGTTTPQDALNVKGVIAAIATGNSDTAYISHTGTVGKIASDYYGSGAYTPLTLWTNGAEQIRITTGGLVGIGSSTPFAKFAVNPVAGDTNQFVVGSSTATSFIIKPNGFVGIGTSNPAAKLQVTGDVYIGQNGTISAPNTVNSIAPLIGLDGSNLVAINANESNTNGLYIFSSSNFMFNSIGLGIGSTSPSTKLSIGGSAYVSGDIRTTNLIATSSISTPSLTLTGLSINSLLSTNASGVITATSTPTFGNFNATSTTATSTISTGGFAVGGNQFLVQQNSGNIGIGTATPSAKLEAIGSNYIIKWGSQSGGAVGGLYSAGNVQVGSFTNHPLQFFTNDSSAQVTLATSGNFGIGTATPTTRLQVAPAGGYTTIGSTNAAISIYDPAVSSANLVFGINGSASNSIQSRDGTSLSWPLALNPFGGNVGIGTTSPYRTLSVVGSGVFTGGDVLASTFTATSTVTVGTKLFVGSYGDASRAINVGGDIGVTAGSQIINVNNSGGIVFNTTNVRTSSPDGTSSLTIGNSSSSYILGNFGVGTTTPGSKLAIAGNAYVDGDIRATNIVATSSISTPSLTLTGLSINSLLSTNASGVITATSTPTFGNFNATSTTATSTLSTGGFAVGTSQFVVQQNSGNVGIGNNSPVTGLDLNNGAFWVRTNAGNLGTGAGAGLKMQYVTSAGGSGDIFAYDYVAGASKPLALQSVGGNVGIGTSTPTSLLAIQGSDPAFTIKSTNSGGIASINLVNSTGSTGGVFSANSSTGEVKVGGSASAFFPTFYSNGSEAMRITTGGNVGIGTTTPGSKLAVSGGASIGANYTTAAPTNGLTVEGSVGIGTQSPTTKLQVNFNDVAGNYLGFQGDGATNGAALWTNWTTGNSYLDFRLGGTTSTYTQMRISSGGNVGIGTTSAASKLAVSGGATIGADYNIAAPTNGLLVEGNVGIGNTSPTAPLVISATPNATQGSIHIRPASGSLGYISFTENGVADRGALGFDAGDSTFYFRNSGTTGTRLLALTSGGNLGLGTTSPSSKLSVAGNAYVDGDIRATNIVATSTISAPSIILTGLAINSILSTNASGLISATSTPTFGNFNATSTVATSTIAGGFAIKGTGFVYDFSTNKVGIGTATPTSPLEVVTVASDVPTIRMTRSGGNYGGFGYGSTNDSLSVMAMGNASHLELNATNAATGNIYLIPKSTANVLITQGSLSIGTSTPVFGLTVFKGTSGFPTNSSGTVGAGVLRLTPGSVGSSMDFGIDSAAPGNSSGTGWIQMEHANDLSTHYSLALNPNGGNVGIGTTTPTYALSAYSATAPQLALSAGAGIAQWTMRNAGGNFYLSTTTVAGTATTTSAALTILGSNGNIGVGTTSPTGTVHISGDGIATQLKIQRTSANQYNGLSLLDQVSNTKAQLRLEGVSTNDIQLLSGTGSGIRFYTNSDLTGSASGEAMRITSAGFVGIGTTTPWGQLSVNPNGITGPAFVIGSSTKTDLIVTNAGNVGVGTAMPGNLGGAVVSTSDKILDVVGAAGQNAWVRVLGGSGGTKGGLLIGNNDNSTVTYGQFTFDNSNNTFTVNQRYASGYLGFGANSRTTDLVIPASTGYVGIGTTSPSSKLSVAGSVYVDGDIRTTNLVATSSISTPSLTLTGLSINSLLSTNASGVITATSTPTFGNFNATSTVATSTISTGGLAVGTSQFVVQQNSGNVGIGTTNPSQKLDVVGSGQFSTSVLTPYTSYTSSQTGRTNITFTSNGSQYGTIQNEGVTGTGAWSLGYQSSPSTTLGTAALTWTGSGLVGIGTTTPATVLSVAGTTARVALFDSTNASGVYTSWMTSGNNNGLIGSGNSVISGGSINDFAISAYGTGALTLGTNGGTARMTILNGGNVGVGITNPGQSLEVVGNVSSRSGTGVSAPVFYLNSQATGSYIETSAYGAGSGQDIIFRYNGTTELARIKTTGLFGIGSSTPFAKLAVNPVAGDTNQFVVGSSTATSFIIRPNGFVGIGTASPVAPFEVSATSSSATSLLEVARLSRVGGTPGGTRSALLSFYDTDNGTLTAAVGGLRQDAGNDYNGSLTFFTNNTGGSPASAVSSLTERMRINNLGNVGIGTTTPGQKLSVAGDILGNNIIGSYFTATSTTATSTISTGGLAVGTSQFVVQQNSGRIGVGTVAPAFLLDVNGTSRFTGTITGSADITFKTTSGNKLNVTASDDSSSLVVMNTGLVGIGTSTPNAILNVNNVNAFTATTLLNYTDARVPFRITTRTGITNFLGVAAVGSGSTGVGFQNVSNDGTTASNIALNPFGGNVGIGTTTPFAKLSVAGTGVSTGYAFAISDVASTTRFVVQDNGNVGIGTTSPETILEIDKSTSGSVDSYVLVKNVNSQSNTGAHLALTGTGGGKYNSIYGVGDGRLFFMTNAASLSALSSDAPKAVILANGNFGIGATSPANKLDVNGSVSVYGNITATNITATSTLTLSGTSINSLLSTNASGVVTATSTPTFGNFNATSTTATSTISTGGLTVGTSQFVVQQNSGFVGIGTLTPSQALTVVGNLRFNTGSSNIDFSGGGTVTGSGNITVNPTAGSVLLTPSTGFVGVATTTPAYALTSYSASAPQLALSAGAGTAQWTARNNAGNLNFATTTVSGTTVTSTSALTILGGNGYVGIGTASPTNTLDIAGLGNNSQLVNIRNSTAGTAALAGYQLGTDETAVTGALVSTGSLYNTALGNAYDPINIANALNLVGSRGGGLNIVASNGPTRFYSGNATTERMRLDTSGNLGIATTTPTYALTAFSATAPQLALSAGAGIAQWTMRNAGGNFYLSTTNVAGTATTTPPALTVLGSSGNVGIGTAVPNNRLDISPAGTAVSGGVGALAIRQGTDSSSGGIFIQDSTQATNLRFWADGTRPHIDSGSTGSNPLSINAGGGNVGIGTNSPAVALDINSATTEHLRLRNDSTNNSYLSFFNSTTRKGYLQFATDNAYLVNEAAGNMSFYTNGSEVITMLSGGNVGIGNNSPGYKLDVGGTLHASGITYADSGVYASRTGIIGSYNSGQVQCAWSMGSPYTCNLGSNNLGTLYGMAYSYSPGSGVGTLGDHELIIAKAGAIGIELGMGGSSTFNGAMTVNGNLSVSNSSYLKAPFGATAPAAGSVPDGSLFVEDNGFAGTLITYDNGARYFIRPDGSFDVAERYPASEPLERGDVVMVDPNPPVDKTTIDQEQYFIYNDKTATKNISVKKADGTSPVIGIISTYPGVLMTNPEDYHNEDKPPVALTGRVPVKFSDENGPVLVGDKLTVSKTIRGYAMKMTESGESIGVALENSAGKTKVEVAINVRSEVEAGIVNSMKFIQSATTTPTLFADVNANVGIGTSTPATKLHVYSNVTSGGVATFTDANASCTIDPTNASLTCSSDERLKKDIVSLTSTSTLDRLMQLRPVTYRWNKEDNVSVPHTGFIAQEVEAIFPEFVATSANGNKSVAYTNFVPVMVQAMQALNTKVNAIDSRLTNLEALVASSTAAETNSGGLLASLYDNVTVWLGNASNTIDAIYAKSFKAKEEICVDDQCLNKDDVRSLLALVRGTATSTPVGGEENGTTTDTSSPIITILGDNPASIIMGASYSDLGATVTDTNADGSVNNNLGLHFSVDGSSVNEISLDTSTTTTHTIIYSAVDGAGNMGYATRTVEVIAQ
jgi:hypothetical protein